MEANTTNLIKKEELSDKQKIILYFFLYAFIGWCLETIYAFIVLGHFDKRGFLYGPICPMYGFGAILVIMNIKHIKGSIIFKFFATAILFSIFEYATSFVLEALFMQRWWDYTNEWFNIQGRICLSFSIIWGIVGVLFVDIIHPFLERHITHRLTYIPLKIQQAVLGVLTSTWIVDTVFSVLKSI